jgi:hypothetical protein
MRDFGDKTLSDNGESSFCLYLFLMPSSTTVSRSLDVSVADLLPLFPLFAPKCSARETGLFFHSFLPLLCHNNERPKLISLMFAPFRPV